MTTPKRSFSRFLPSFADLLALAGLSSLGYGLWLYKPLVAFVVVGALLLVGGVAGHIHGSRRTSNAA